MPSPLHPGANCASRATTLSNISRALSRSTRAPERDMNDESSARACRYCSDNASARAALWAGSPFCCSFPRPCRVPKTSLQISVCTAMRSKEGTLMVPPERTLCPGTSSSCQLRSKPCSERMKLPASTNCTSSFLPTDNGSICCMGTGNCIGQRVTVQGGFARLSEVLEGQHENRILLLRRIGRLAKALCQHGEKSRCPFLALSRRHMQIGCRFAGENAGFELHRLHDGLQGFTKIGSRGIASAGCLVQTGSDHTRQLGGHLGQRRRIGKLNRT